MNKEGRQYCGRRASEIGAYEGGWRILDTLKRGVINFGHVERGVIFDTHAKCIHQKGTKTMFACLGGSSPSCVSSEITILRGTCSGGGGTRLI